MTALLLAFVLMQVSPAPKGFATGIVRSATGTPASGVRVYAIPAGDPNAAAAGATVVESLAQTDATGRYRLEIPVGRYYIAVGSVASPTYYPDTASIASAKAVSIVAGATIESVDFSRYNVATTNLGGFSISQPTLPPGSTGVLSGVVRTSDGSAASGVTVLAVPVSVVSNPPVGSTSASFFYLTNANQTVVTYRLAGGAQSQIVRTGGSVVTDAQGRYRIENVSPDTYNIVAGVSDSPAFYPGTSDVQKATGLVTTPTTTLTNLDFTLPPPAKLFSIRGRVSANDGRPAGGATVSFRSMYSGTVSAIGGMLPSRTYRPVTSGGDGTFEIPDVPAGRYIVQAGLSGIAPLSKTIDVTDRAVDVAFDFSINVLTGRIVWEDGSPFSDPAVSQVAVSTTSNPNFIATTLFPVSSNGIFSGVIDAGDYRFFLKSLPADYTLRAMTAGTVDLLKETLHATVDVPTQVEIRIAKGPGSGTRIRGKIVDAVSGAAPTADRVDLCCFATGPFERMSSAILPDGRFDFSGMQPGHYTAELRRNAGQPIGTIVNGKIEISGQDESGLVLVSAGQVAPVSATVTYEGAPNPPASAPVTVTLTISVPRKDSPNAPPEEVSIPMARILDESYWMPFPNSVRYTVSVGNIPDGYSLKSVSGPGSTSAVLTVTADGATKYSGFAPGVLAIVLQRTPAK